ncbi:type I-E CRISPR-associated protein Cas5/CasD [Acrocarpospora phusangensis]|uniref:Type I-E CRISPR-associated protein Cas5/CasD n=1 Tax=Acrocarpospora phusangensis TaxID=1070424 RepID=A0A919QK29_9ACTN|nr:type I-E CRISPR-associated protein Cas5/CasD [Acrocarpospora phusangensis]GIH29589.1 type I-E CRISPR-associated protein Cas5/CasD [Acrocarpospora phusangensis]
MSGLIVRLAGPLQSWGEHSVFTQRDTLRFPTRSGLVGLFASAEGVRRGRPLGDYGLLRFTVRIDRPGVRMMDFHTIGGGLPRGVPRPNGAQRSREKATMLTRRQYLSDAAFTVAVEGPEERIAGIAEALRRPHWQPFLGRRSCPPDQPVLLRAMVDDPVSELRSRAPVARRLRSDELPEAEFVTEGVTPDAEEITELADAPESFNRYDRRYRPRIVSVETRPISAHLFATGPTFWDQLLAYAKEER